MLRHQESRGSSTNNEALSNVLQGALSRCMWAECQLCKTPVEMLADFDTKLTIGRGLSQRRIPIELGAGVPVGRTS